MKKIMLLAVLVTGFSLAAIDSKLVQAITTYDVDTVNRIVATIEAMNPDEQALVRSLANDALRELERQREGWQSETRNNLLVSCAASLLAMPVLAAADIAVSCLTYTIFYDREPPIYFIKGVVTAAAVYFFVTRGVRYLKKIAKEGGDKSQEFQKQYAAALRIKGMLYSL